jgi:hypothetical protein
MKTNIVTCNLIKLDSAPNNYEIFAQNTLDQITISGTVTPRLQHNWKITIKNKLSNKEIMLPQEVRIPIMTAYLVRNILKQEHLCIGLWFYNKQKYKLQVKLSSQDIDNTPSPQYANQNQIANLYPVLSEEII